MEPKGAASGWIEDQIYNGLNFGVFADMLGVALKSVHESMSEALGEDGLLYADQRDKRDAGIGLCGPIRWVIMEIHWYSKMMTARVNSKERGTN